MKKINKQILFATDYKNWEATETNFPEYSASFRFHKDILYQLLICQEGLCAYTEKLILNEAEIDNCKTNFVNGKYNNTNFEIAVDLEHFDSTLKTINPWKWDNFFAVDRAVNQSVKRIREPEMIKKYNGKGVNDILKPDSNNYSPFDLLVYDWKKHEFYPNPKTIENNTFDLIGDMIYVLGLNFGFVKRERKAYLELFLDSYKSKKINKPIQYITAFAMYKQQNNIL